MLCDAFAGELIVTQWDVNDSVIGFGDVPAAGINSYIVGCKCRQERI